MFWLSEYFVAFGKVVATKLEGASKAILENIEALDGDSSTGEPQFGPLGRYARPMPPVDKASATGLNPEGEAESIGLRLGDNIHQIGAYRDLRLNAQVNPAEGAIGDAHYGGGFIEQSWNADKTGTTITLYAPHKDANGAADHASVVTIDSSPGNEAVLVLHKTGASFAITPDGKVVMANAAGDAYVEVNDSGVVINGASVNITGSGAIGASNPALAEALAKAADVEARFEEFVGAFLSGATAPNDGGTALKASVQSALGLAGWAVPAGTPPTVATTQTKGV